MSQQAHVASFYIPYTCVGDNRGATMGDSSDQNSGDRGSTCNGDNNQGVQ